MTDDKASTISVQFHTPLVWDDFVDTVQDLCLTPHRESFCGYCSFGLMSSMTHCA